MTELAIGAKIAAFFGKVPRWVWIALAILAAAVALAVWHGHAVKKFGDERYQAGVNDEAARVAAAARKLEAKAAALSAKIRSNNDETNRRIAGDADALRLSGPGKAAYPHCPSSAPAGQPRAADHRTDDGGAASLPRDDRAADRAIVPWGWLVGRGEQCDLDRAEALSWRDWYARQNALANPVQQ